MTSIDPKEAASTLSDIDAIAHRVRQSRIYYLASLMLMLWGVLVFAGYLATYLSQGNAGFVWPTVYAAGIAGSFAVSAFGYARTRTRSFDARAFIAFLLFMAFGMFVCWFAQFAPRQLGAFWPIYFMLAYTIAGLWVGYAFAAIGLSIITLTLIGYFFAGDAFDLWMAFVNGGGLIVGGLWMRRD
jgi:hypothetical protein